MNPADVEHSSSDRSSNKNMANEGSSKFDENMFTTSPSPQRTALPLKRFLAQAPKRSLYQYNSIAQQSIIVKCFQSMWHDNIDYMQKYFFPNATGDRRNLKSIIAKHRQQVNSVGSTTLSNNTENVILDEDSDGPEYWESQRGRQCGHVFKKGEAIYQCRNCAFDDTCVFCSRCYHATDHEGHDVSLSISPGAGGCCDCGDPEAWKVPVICSIHSIEADNQAGNGQNGEQEGNNSNSSSPGSTLASKVPLSSVPPDLLDSIRGTISGILDFMIETLSTSPEEISFLRSEDEIEEEARATMIALGVLPDFSNHEDQILQDFDDDDMEDDDTAPGGTYVPSKSQQPGVEDASMTEKIGIAGYVSEDDDDDEKEIYSLVLWNDETHSFDEVIDVVTRATLCSATRAKAVAEAVDSHGREVVLQSTNLLELVKTAKIISSIGLAVTIRSARDVFREQVCFLLCDWMNQIVSGHYKFFPDVQDGNTIIRDIICEELCKEWALKPALASLSTRYRRKSIPTEEEDDENDDIEDDDDDDDMPIPEPAMMESIVVDDLDEDDVTMYQLLGAEPTDVIDTFPSFMQRQQFETSDDSEHETEQSSEEHEERREVERKRWHERRKHGDIADLSWDLSGLIQEFKDLDNQELNFSEQIGASAMAKKKQRGDQPLGSQMLTEFKQKLRLDYFMLLDLRLWKDMRMCLRKMFISTLVANLSYKRILGVRFARNYPSVADAFLLRDREFTLSVILFSVQLLTVPTIATTLVADYNFFGIMCSVLSSFFLTDQIILPLGDRLSELRINCERRAFVTRKYYNAFHDLRYIINPDAVRKYIRNEPLLMRQYLDFVSIFQGMNPIVRQSGSHVEYESTAWVDAFNVTLQVAKIGRRFSDAFAVRDLTDDNEHLAPLQLARAIMRVLKHLTDWIPGKHEVRDESSPFLQYSQLRVAGVQEQEFHTVKTVNAGDFSVVKFDVSKDPVSFHQPVHWLLSELLENVHLLDEAVLERAGWSGGINAMVSKLHDIHPKFSPYDTILSILDWPMRTMVLLCQIRSGFWVRNGFGVRNQAHHYRDVSLRENTFDTDLYLLQFGFVLVNPDHLFTTILDRFGLLAWFSGKLNQSPYDSSQVNYMVEEMLSLLIVFGSERAHAAHLSLEDKIRREITQNLCISPMAHSELGKKITESMSEDAKFDRILSAVAKFKAPDGLNDHGVYELKPEYYNNIDPHFWHYTRNNREDVEAALQKIWKKERESQGLDANPQDFFIIPKLARITSGPFSRMGNMLHSRVLLQIIFYALWNCKNSPAPTSDTITEQALYLAMMALVDENNDYTEDTYDRHAWDREENGLPGFIWHATTDSFPVIVNDLERERISLLQLLFKIIEDTQMASLHKRCLWIVDNIEARGKKEVKDQIRIWREERRVLHSHQTGGADGQQNLSDSDRKKLAAKERQAKIMAQFAQAQSNFMSQNEDMYDDEDTDTDMEVEEEDRHGVVPHDGLEISDDGELEVQRKFHFPTGTCIVCQEEADSSQLYGMLAFIQPSTLLRQTPLDDADVIADVFNMKQGLDVELPQEEPIISEKSSSSKKQPRASNVHGFPPQSHKSGLHMSTCSHLMHVKCFETYYASIEARHAAQSRYKHPENIERLEYLCPLCKALGNTLLPIVWKGKTESYPGVLAGANDQLYETFINQGVDELLAQIEKRRQFEPSKFLKDRFWMTMTSDLSSRLPWSGRLSGRTTGVDESVLEAMNVTVDPTDMILVKKMYSRLARVLEAIVKSISPETSVLVDTKLLESMDLLWGVYGYTISSIEIAQRGRSNQASSDLTVERTGTLIDSISDHTRTLLRIFSETVMLYKRVFHEDREIDSQEKEASVNVARVAQLFYGNKAVRTMLESDRKATVVFENLKPLLEDEPFLVLVELSMSMVPNLELNIHHFVRQLFTAEIVKAAVALLQGLTGNEKLAGDRARKHLEAYRQQNDTVDKETVRGFTNIVMDTLSVPRDFVDRFFQTISEAAFINLLRSFALPYLRRCMILLVVRHGLIIQPLEKSGEEVPEFDRLLKCLRLPTLDQIMKDIIRQPATVSGWCQHYIDYSRKTSTSLIRTNAPAYTQLLRISVGLPTVFHLVDLPNRLDQLFEESMHKACRKCGNVPNDPALCLLCGTFVCLQGYCCMEGEQGECNMHTAICGGEVGAYIWIRRSLLLLLYNGVGCFMTAPYLDAHGEADFGFIRGRPQYLSKKRYEQYQQLWLTQNIPTYVARTIEPTHHSTDWSRL